MAESGILIDDFSKYSTVKVEGNKYVVYGVFAMVTIFIVYFVIVYKPPKPFEKGKTIRWVVTGDPSNNSSRARYSYNGIDYIETEGQFLDVAIASAFGKSYDNDNFFWIVGGDGVFSGNPSSMTHTYNGYDWIANENPLEFTGALAFGLSGNNEPLWLATGNILFDKSNIIYSKNGLSWEYSTGVEFQQGFAIAYGKTISDEHMYLAGGTVDSLHIGNNNASILYSFEGMCWMISEGYSFISSQFGCLGIEYGLCSFGYPVWVAIGEQLSGFPPVNIPGRRHILYSEDGINWKPSTGEDFAFIDNFGGIGFGLDSFNQPIWVAVGISHNLYSRDGKHWNRCTGLSFNTGYSVAYGKDSNDDNLWVATGYSEDNKNEILISYDGIDWLSSEDPAFGNSAAYSVTSNVLKYGVKPFI